MKRMLLLLLAMSLLMMVLPLGAFAAGESEYVMFLRMTGMPGALRM